LFAALFSLQVVPRFFSDAPTADEPPELANGYFYWHGDLLTNPKHPPLFKALAALPLRLLPSKPLPRSGPAPTNYEERFKDFFFDRHRGDFQTLFAEGRAVIWLFGLGIGLLLWRIARERSLVFAVSVMALWAFEPSLLAFSGLVYADVPAAFFYLGCVMAFRAYLDRPGPAKAALWGLTTGLALTVKFSALTLLPLYVLMAGLEKGWEPRFKPRTWKELGTATGAALAAIGLVYLPGTLILPEHRLPWAYFLEGFRDLLSDPPNPVFFRGQLGTQSHWAYYPVVLLLKTPLSLLLLAVTAWAWQVWSKKGGLPLFFWVPGALFLLFMLPLHQLGVREILPVHPFLILTAGWGAQVLFEHPWKVGWRWARFVPAAALIFQGLSVGTRYPAQLSYFNEMVDPGKRSYWLGDSNLDLGQDTRRFAEFALAQGWPRVKLAFLSATDPALYGLKWEPWDKKDIAGPQPGSVYAVNTAYLQLAPAFQPGALGITQGWIATAHPTGQVGDTWFYFVVPAGEVPNR
jgi:hypothetical protein